MPRPVQHGHHAWGQTPFLLSASGLAFPTPVLDTQRSCSISRAARGDEQPAGGAWGGDADVWELLAGQAGQTQVCAETGDTLCWHVLLTPQGHAFRARPCKLGLKFNSM